MTDREWPEYPDQAGEEIVTGPESAQAEAAPVRGEEEYPSSPASQAGQTIEAQDRGQSVQETAEESQDDEPMKISEPDSQTQENQETEFLFQNSQESSPVEDDTPAAESLKECQETISQSDGQDQDTVEPLAGENPEISATEAADRTPDAESQANPQEAIGQPDGQTRENGELSFGESPEFPGAEAEGLTPDAEHPADRQEAADRIPDAGQQPVIPPPYQNPGPSVPAAQTPPYPRQNPGWQAPYQQAPQNYPYPQGQYQGGWYSQPRQAPPYYGRTPYQAPNPYQNQGLYGYPARPGYYQGQPGYPGGYQPPVTPQPPVRPVTPPPQPPASGQPENPNAQPPEKKGMNKKTKAFLWVIGIVLVLLCVAMVLYSVGMASGWFGQTAEEPAQTSSSVTAPEDDKKLLEIEEIPQDGMMTPNQVYEKVKHSVVAVVTYGQGSDLTDSPISTGSGIVFSEDGYIVTNSHVIGDSNQYPVKVVFTGQDENEADKEYAAQVVGYDKRTDIAVLKIDAIGLIPAEFADSDQLKVGDTVLSLGNPGVAGENFTNTLTKGMVSAVNRTVNMSSINMQYIQTDVAINPGSSGGALLNLYGQVVGINAAKITTTEIEGICFAIPTNIAKDVINDIVKNGYVSGRVRLGVTVRSLSAYEAEMYNVPQGLVIVGFSDDSEIPSKGAEIGDIITAINGVETTSSNTLYSELENYKAGETVSLTIYRQASGDQRATTFDIEVTLLEDRGETQIAVTPEMP